MRTATLETAPQMVLRDCSKEVGCRGRSVYVILVKGKFMQSSIYRTKCFLLVVRS